MTDPVQDAVVVRRDGAHVVVAFRGDVDAAVGGHLAAHVLPQLGAPLAGLRVDLAECTFLDSAGLAAVSRLWRHAVEHDVPFGLLHPQRNVRLVLAIAGLDELVQGHPLAEDLVRDGEQGDP
jgi:anti-anti-sigma factor